MEKPSSSKYINLDNIYNTLVKITEDKNYSVEERTEIKRFIQKVSESSSFLNVVNAAFSSNERKRFSDNFKKALTGELRITEDLIIRYNNKRKWWDIYTYQYDSEGKHEVLFLDKLDWNLTKNIIVDVNTAFLIKSSRDEKNK